MLMSLNDAFVYYITLEKLPFYIRITNYLISAGHNCITVSVCTLLNFVAVLI